MRDDFSSDTNGSRWLNEALVATWQRGKLFMGSSNLAAIPATSPPYSYELLVLHFMVAKRRRGRVQGLNLTLTLNSNPCGPTLTLHNSA